MTDEAYPYPAQSWESPDAPVRVVLHGGPLEGKVLFVPSELPRRITFPGRRHGNHTVWLSHLYAYTGERYEYQETQYGVTAAIHDGPYR